MEQMNKPLDDNQTMDINADADIPGKTHLTNPDSADEPELEKLRQELEEQKDKYIRLIAEFDNFKRRTARERIELIQTAGKETILSLLDVLDDCDRAEKQMEQTQDLEVVKQGNTLVFAKLRNTLMQKGLTVMNSIGEEFDVEKHEAITELEVPADKKGKVVDELEKGYYLNDKIIRFAKVVVGK